MTATAPPRVRIAWIDSLRGIAIALMLLDHALVIDYPYHPLRYTLTRLAMPAFMIAAALVHRSPTPRRFLYLVPAIAIELVIAPLVLSTGPSIVTIYALVLVIVWAIDRTPLTNIPAVILLFALIQAMYMPVPWSGYQPGLVLAWFMLGRLAGTQFSTITPVAAPLAAIGRHPLAWYCGHLVVFAGYVLATSS